MKAIAIDDYGAPDRLHEEDLPTPDLADDEVLVKVRATSINPIDWKARLGLLKPMYDWSFPVVLGWDVAGIIEQVGPAVKHFKIGDPVFARPDIYQDGRRGTYAQFAAVKEDKLAFKPANLTFAQAAAVPLAGLTAWQVVLDRIKIQSGEKILIQGGAGGVGLFAVQIAKHAGAYVATTASPTNAGLLKRLGADKVIDYHTTDIIKALHDYDAVFDTINAIDDGLAILKTTGRLVTIAGQPSGKQRDAKPSAEGWWLQPNGRELAALGDLVGKGIIEVVIDSVHEFSAEGLRTAHERSQSRHAVGKIVIDVDAADTTR